MSKYMAISCAMCGRDLYRPLTIKELREGKHMHFPGFYISQNKSGKEEEYCEKCYEAMLKAEDRPDIDKHVSESEEISREELAALLARGARK